MHCQRCGDELNFESGADPKRCDLCMSHYRRFEDPWEARRDTRRRADYHQRRLAEEAERED